MTSEELLSIIQSKSEGLIFAETGHKYFYNGKEVPSVSKIIEPLSRLIYGDGQYAQYQTGADVHLAIQMYLENGWRVWEEEIDGYMMGFEQWYESFNGVFGEIVTVEKPITNGEYAGTPDIIALMNGEPIIIDIKTSKSAKWNLWKTQLSAYANIFDGKEWKRAILQLKGDNDYKFQIVCDETEIFYNMLNVYRYSKMRNNAKGVK